MKMDGDSLHTEMMVARTSTRAVEVSFNFFKPKFQVFKNLKTSKVGILVFFKGFSLIA